MAAVAPVSLPIVTNAVVEGDADAKAAKKRKRSSDVRLRMQASIDPKSVLNTVLQKHFDRPISKGEIAFTTMEVTGGYQSSVTVAQFADSEVNGEVKASKKDAEQSAAYMCLKVFKDELMIPNEVMRAVEMELETRALGGKKTGTRFQDMMMANLNMGMAGAALPPDAALPPEFSEMAGKAAAKGMPPQMIDQMKKWAGMMMMMGGGKGPGSAAAAAAAAAAVSGGGAVGGAQQDDPKSKLNQWLQHHLKRPITKEDALYRTEQVDGGYQATLTLACLQGQEFAGEVAKSMKGAEKAAAKQALQHYESEVTNMQPLPKKRKVAASSGGSAAVDGGSGEPDSKNQLGNFLQKLLNRPLTKSDVTYNTAQYEEGFQSTVNLHCLDGSQIVGELGPNAKAAEKLAAAMALQVHADKVLEVQSRPPKPQTPFIRKGGKGRGKSIF